MCILHSFALMTLLAGSSLAAPDRVSNRFDPARAELRPRILSERNVASDGREGGEDIGTALEIPGDVDLLPYHDTGNTCDNRDDYEEQCYPVSSTAPDVVYRFTPSRNVHVSLDLCASDYDSKVWIYDAAQTVIACDEGSCPGGNAFLFDVPLTGHETYYLVVDGTLGRCGSYDLNVVRQEHCELECPVDAQVEEEPPCVDDYMDTYNGGCQDPDHPAFIPIAPDANGCATLCGRSCTYRYQGMSYRDTDWYEAYAAGGPVSITCRAQFPVMLWLTPFTWCYLFDGYHAFGGACESVQLSQDLPPNEWFWFRVSPSLFGGIPESDWVCTICGLVPGAVPVENMTWGRIKARYR